MLLSAKGNGRLCTPKGNGIKDGFVSWVCVYAVVFWMLRFPGAILHVYFIFLNGLYMKVYGRKAEEWGGVSGLKLSVNKKLVLRINNTFDFDVQIISAYISKQE